MPDVFRSRTAAAVALATVMLAASAVVLVAWDRGGGSPSQPIEVAAPEIETHADVAPSPVLFGDTVRATVDVLVDADRIEPASVRAAADFSPWDVVGTPERRVVSAGAQALVRTTFVLRCLTGACIPSGRFSVYDFDPGRVSFASKSNTADEGSVEVPLPSIHVYSRLTGAVPEGGPRSAPWQTDLLSLPAPSFRSSPGILILLCLLAALVATIGALTLAYRAWPRAADLPPPKPVPAPPPAPRLSALEQALILLEGAVRVNGAAEQRRALELVAEELERAAWGDATLANTARALAWSEGVPHVDRTSELAARVRAVLDDGQQRHVNGDRNGT